MEEAANIFFMGKGGVGKSTSSALISLYRAREGFRVLLVSLDPAHNQGDIFEKRFSDKPRPVAPRLMVMEIDQDRWIKRYLKEVREHIHRTYIYLTAFNLERHFQVIKHSPGLEEYALILAFKEIRKTYADFDFLIFDMPPTALSLRFFTLPNLSLIWVEQLLRLRREIIEKRELITRIKFGRKEYESDKVLKRIEALQVDYRSLKAIFTDPDRTRIQLVLNPDQLSFAESLRILKGLEDLRIGVNQIIYNKMNPEDSCAEWGSNLFSGVPLVGFPASRGVLIGVENLREYLEKHLEGIKPHLDLCTHPLPPRERRFAP
jgi:arsenite/tail-anchored protein-transporting ATPase